MIFRLLLAAWGILILAATATAKEPEPNYMGRVRWARLKTESPTWDRHARADPSMLQFIRENTTLNIDPSWYAVDVEELPKMSAYPFLFSEGIHHVTDEPGRANLGEYLKRGGFIFIDACINTGVNPDPDAFVRMQVDQFKSILPKVRIERIDPSCEIFHTPFDMKDGLPHTYMNNIYNPEWAKHGLYAVYNDKRLVSIISVSGLQCGWDRMFQNQAHITNCVKMMVDIYVYVTTH